MIKLIQGNEVKNHQDIMEQVWRLRHDVFVEEKKWGDLQKPDKREIDQYDNDDVLHMLAFDGDQVVGYQRMLPTTKPYLLSDVYPQLCEGDLPRAPEIWEWTRYAVIKEHRARGRMLSSTANKLLSAIVEWGLETGVSTIIIEMNPLWLLRLVQLHFRVIPLGITHVLADEEVLAVQAHFDERTLIKLQEIRGDKESVLDAKAYRLTKHARSCLE
ncbi:acyl-homoserine-lactone synthase [Lentilitoribacter sp. EG35]|uniref:acyl-homoserine-lactone synthase n=1 Tax=Lentilitoribacter sp. EG35 TaxID=3234192 RepID=UPI003460BDBF